MFCFGYFNIPSFSLESIKVYFVIILIKIISVAVILDFGFWFLDFGFILEFSVPYRSVGKARVL